MMTPFGIRLEVGQLWRECDKRFNRVIEIVSWDEETQRVTITSGDTSTGRKTYASLKRFNGKSSGYKPI